MSTAPLTVARDRPVFPGKTLRVPATRPSLLRARDGLVWVTYVRVHA